MGHQHQQVPTLSRTLKTHLHRFNSVSGAKNMVLAVAINVNLPTHARTHMHEHCP